MGNPGTHATAYLDRLYISGLYGFEAHETEDGGRLHSDNSSGMFIVLNITFLNTATIKLFTFFF